MDEQIFYSVTEDGQQIERLESLYGAASLWNERRGSRSVYEVSPGTAPNEWTTIGQVGAEKLADALEGSE